MLHSRRFQLLKTTLILAITLTLILAITLTLILAITLTLALPYHCPTFNPGPNF